MSHINKAKEINQQHHTITKSDTVWPLHIELTPIEREVGRWIEHTVDLGTLALNNEQIIASYGPESHYHEINLELYKDERTDYRFNLSSEDPKIFVVMEQIDSNNSPKLIAVTVSQAAIGNYLDGDYLVLSTALPLPIQAWMEAFIGRHGELLELGRKKRKGAGRSCGQ
ncbi:DUF3305 domain-containing protein [Aliivibrio kagoshimensis]|uniref:DUF3305 domain-containing protein n=1 Tax=Aliivibrio kagoshimensis TaxID=2910230 RepID=UPI003D0B6FA2